MANSAAPPNAYILSYLSANADNFKNYAQAMGLPPTAAVAAAVGVSEEAKSVMKGIGTIGDTTYAVLRS